MHVQPSGIFEHLRHPDPDAAASGAHPDLASEGAGQGNKGPQGGKDMTKLYYSTETLFITRRFVCNSFEKVQKNDCILKTLS